MFSEIILFITLLHSDFKLKDGVTLSPKGLEIAIEVDKLLDKTFIITSGIRSPEEQARLLIINHRRGVNLYKLYGWRIEQYMRHIIEGNHRLLALMIDKYKNISKHLSGNAIDISVRNLSKEDIRKVKTLNNKGYKVLYEKNPPHIHIQVL